MYQQNCNNNNQSIKINHELRNRREKLTILRSQGGITFPNDFRRQYLSSDLHRTYDSKTNMELTALNINVSVAGRMITRRIIGKASFATLQDMGGKIQIYISLNDFTEYIYNEQFRKLDLGDIIGIKGKLFKTKIGELTIHSYELYLLTKALRPLPNKYHGLLDHEKCYRQRYLDLITNNSSRNTFIIRSRVLSAVRKFMIRKDFMEVETPMMQVIPGGASARPFITYHNELDLNMYLRISPELYLKRLVIGGFERIFEVNRNFRNEGVSPYHNPEFTMIELYMAYADYTDLMVLTEELFRAVTNEVLGTTKIKYGNNLFDFSKPFDRMTMKEALVKYCNQITISDFDNLNQIILIANDLDIKINKEWKIGRLQYELFEKVVKNNLIQPTFITEYPIEVSPLARRNDNNPLITDRFEIFISGLEIGNGFSELNDAEDQAERFLKQVKDKEKEHDTPAQTKAKDKDQNQISFGYSNAEESIFYDEDYLTALEYGLPPTAGLGIGIDRMIMLLTNRHTIRDVILFPILRPGPE